MAEYTPLYNSRIIKTYLEYLDRQHPGINQDAVLAHAGIKKNQVEDPSHWFGQEHTDRFQEYVTRETGNPTISRDAGRYATQSQGMGTAKKYVLGLLTPHSAFQLISKIYATVSRGALVSARRIAHNKVEITATPQPGVEEKPYQCLNRMGSFESIPWLFVGAFGQAEEQECWHKGGTCCRYIITWASARFLLLKQARNILLLLGILGLGILWFMAPWLLWIHSAAGVALLILMLTAIGGHLERGSLQRNIATQGDLATQLMAEMGVRQNNALLAQDIGTAASAWVTAEELILPIVKTIAGRLEMDRVRIMLLNEGRGQRPIFAGFGFSPGESTVRAESLDLPFYRRLDSKVLVANEPRYLDLSAEAHGLNDEDARHLQTQQINSLITVPILYEASALGTLTVARLSHSRKIEPRELNSLMGVAAQVATSVVNTISVQLLQDSEKKYRDLVEHANSLIVRFDTDGNIIFFNEFAQRLFGSSDPEIMGDNFREMIFKGTAVAGQHRAECPGRPAGPASRQAVSENEHILPDGRRIWVTWTYRPIQDHTGKVVETLCIGNDITELKRAQQEKARTEVQLLQAQKMEAIGTLAGGVAHDFNNLLMGILGSASLVLDEMEPGHPHLEAINDIKDYAQRAGHLTRQLLGFARGGKYEIKLLDLNRILEKTARMFARTKKEIDLVIDLDQRLWTVEADPGQMEQVLLNHYVNAWQAMPGGGRLLLRTENVRLDEVEAAAVVLGAGRYVRIAIEDAGEGMDEATQKRVFDPFFTTKGIGGGTGLGLASAYGIITNHGGTIKIKSAPGQGAAFSIYLPASDRAAHTERDEKLSIETGKGSILLIDDEDLIINVGKKLLTRIGYTVTAISSGEEALEHFKAHHGSIDLILLDMIMPQMNGGQVFDRLREIDPEAKVILCSGYSLDHDAQEILDRGCNGFLHKPYSLEQLSEKLQSHLKP